LRWQTWGVPASAPIRALPHVFFNLLEREINQNYSFHSGPNTSRYSPIKPIVEARVLRGICNTQNQLILACDATVLRPQELTELRIESRKEKQKISSGAFAVDKSDV
jgi:hypothetical protein